MKLYLTLFYVLVFSFSIQAQTSGEIEYGIKMIFNPVDSLDRTQKQQPSQESAIAFSKKIKEAEKLLPQLKYYLKFNEKESLFYLKDFMVNDSDRSLLEFPLILSNSKETYYNSYQNDTVLIYRQAELGGQYFLVNKKNPKWKLSFETKEIAGCVCRKATTKDRRNDLIKLTITAWYCPDLPYNYGVKNFSGLPGLVLGLEEHGFYYYAKKINIKKDHQTIKTPKGKRIEEKKYNKKVEDYYSQFYEDYN